MIEKEEQLSNEELSHLFKEIRDMSDRELLEFFFITTVKHDYALRNTKKEEYLMNLTKFLKNKTKE